MSMVGVRAETSAAPRAVRHILIPTAAALMCTACAQNGLEMAANPLNTPQSNAAETAPTGEITTSALPPVTSGARQTASTAAPAPASEIAVSPATAAAIRAARAARESGKKAEALAGLDKSDGATTDPALLSERGMLALELGQTAKAEQLLKDAITKGATDWRVRSAHGAALSANGNQGAAQAELGKALEAAPNEPAVLNNLALSYALDGKHGEAERLLRQAADRTTNPQASQNLALILGLNGKVGEAKAIAERSLPPDSAAANVAYFQNLQARGGAGGASVSRTGAASDGPSPFRSANADTSTEPIMRLGPPE
ncbi:MAG: hypothetical protein NW216_03680 [Hyphomicrobium sp.]|nr:hypothetical protein [Hyphomicrobium sp.]